MTETVVAVIRAKLNLPDVSAFVSAFAPLISPGGMFVRTRQLKEPGTVIRFDFSLASGERLLLGEGIVRQVRDGSDGSPAGMLIKFTKLNRASKDLVDQIVEHKGFYSQPQDDGHADDLYDDEDEIPASNAAQTPEPEPEPEPEPPVERPRPSFVEPLQRSSPARVAPSSSSGRILSTGDVLSALRDAPPDDDVPTVGLPLNAPAPSRQPTGLGFLGLDESEVDDVLGNLFGDSQDQGVGFGSMAGADLDAPPSIAIVGASFPFAAPKDTPAEIASNRPNPPPDDEASPPDEASEDLFLAEESEDDDGPLEDNDDPYAQSEPFALPVAAPVEPEPEEDDLDDEGPYHPGDQLPDRASAFDDPYPVDQPPSFDDDEDDAPADSPAFELSEGDDLDDEVVEPDEDIIEDSLDSFDDDVVDDDVVDADIVDADIVDSDIVDSADDEHVEEGDEIFDAGDDDDAPIAFADEPEDDSDDEPLEVDAPAEEGEKDAIRIHRGAAGFVLMDDDVSIDADERDRQIFSGNLEEALAAEREANENQSPGIHPSRQTMQWQTGVIHDANQPGEDEEDEEDEEDYAPPQLSEDMGIDVDLADEPLQGERGEPDDAEDDEADRGRGGVFFFGEGGAPDKGEPLEVDVDLDGFAPEDDDSEDGFDLDDEARARESLETQQPNRVLGRIQLKRRTVSAPPDPLGPDDDPVIADFADDDEEDVEAALTTAEILTLQSANIESDSGRTARTGAESLDFFLDDEDDAPRVPRPFSPVVPAYKPESTERTPSITGMSELGGLLDEIQGRGDDRQPMSASALHLATGTALGAEMERDEGAGEDGEIPSLAGLVSAAHQELDDRDDEVASDSILDQVLGGEGPRIVPPNRNFDVPSPAESNLLAGKKKKGFFSRLFGSDD